MVELIALEAGLFIQQTFQRLVVIFAITTCVSHVELNKNYFLIACDN